MKKYLPVILSIIILISFGTNTFAQTASGRSNANPGNLKDVKHYIDGKKDVVRISLDCSPNYNVLRLKSPDRLVIDIANTSAPGKQQVIEVASSLVKSIRYAQFEQFTSRVVLDTLGQPEYQIEKKANELILYIYDPSSSIDDKDSNSDDTEKSDNSNNRGDIDRQTVSIYKDFNIEYSASGTNDEVTIATGSYKDYNIMRLTGPDRIVIDIPNVKLPASEKKVDVNSSQVKTIRYAQFNNNTARVVLDVAVQSQFNVNEKKGKLVLNIQNPTYKNITYSNNSDRVCFLLNGAKLTEGDEFLKALYTGNYDKTGKKYTITFPENLADLGSGTMWINDGLLNSVEIINNKNDKNTSIVFNATQKFEYNIITRPGAGDTAITILKPALNNEKLVVIDAGHGGYEPGAIYGNLKEKDLNLDIALRLNSLLKKKKVKTYMIREHDSYVGLYERAYIANKLNASLFLSIHNNAMGDKGYDGTMTLYYPSRSNNTGFSGKTFAQIIQDKLLIRLKTTNRSIRERPNLVVLKATTMPAALAEVAFMTNSNDRNNLQKSYFRQRAAQSLCDAIIKSLDNIK